MAGRNENLSFILVIYTQYCEKLKSEMNFCISYCYETIIFQYAIVTDRAGVQPIGCRLGPRPQAQACG